MPDLDRKNGPCPMCGGSGKEIVSRKQIGLALVPIFGGKCETCGGSGSIPETSEDYAARLRALVEQARAELVKQNSRISDAYIALGVHLQDKGPDLEAYVDGDVEDLCNIIKRKLRYAYQAVAGKDGADGQSEHPAYPHGSPRRRGA